jgi:hypothetical protein
MDRVPMLVKLVDACMNRVFKPRSEWPAFREWAFGIGACAAFYATIFIQSHELRLWIRIGAMALALLQLFFWSSLARPRR